MNIESGNLEKVQSKHRGWIAGHFIDKFSGLKTDDLEIKWGIHKKGEARKNASYSKKARSLAILISGKILFEFPKDNQKISLRKKGDYVFYDAKVLHKWSAEFDSEIITIRWPSLLDDQVQIKETNLK